MAEWNPRANELFLQAVEIGSSEQLAEFLDRECGDDERLREEVGQLLESHRQAGSLLEHPAFEAVSTNLVFGSNPGDELGDANTVPESESVSLDFLSPSENPGSLGQLGQYEILEVVGRGGMGIVLKAQDTRLNRIVAVKVLAPELATHASARKRFLREARAAAAVSHDHIVTIHAVEENPVPHLVMEYIDGMSLQQKIDAEGQVEVKEVLRVARQVAAGLAAAHEQGLTHRDIKPSNILLQNGIQRVQITDFGLARAASDADITRTGEITGTPQFMSPEQAQNGPVDQRSDLFALGGVMYAMCCGHSPFRADSTYGAIKRVCEDEPRSIRENNPEIPPWLETIIFKLLEKNPDDRIQTASETAELLGKHLAHLQDPGSTPFPRKAPAKPTHRKLSHPRTLAAAAVMLLAVIALGFTEATGVTNFTGTVIRMATGEGVLIIEVDDPTVQVSVDGEELSISGAGLEELKLRPGQYDVQAFKDGEPIKQELVTVSRGDRQVVHVSLEGNRSETSAPDALIESTAFVVQGRESFERKFGTLAAAVQGSSPGDTIEIRGDGPFVTDSIEIRYPLTIRAADGYRPIVELSESATAANRYLIFTSASLVVEGIELRRSANDRSDQYDYSEYSELVASIGCHPVMMANCRCRLDKANCVVLGSNGAVIKLRNCEFYTNGTSVRWDLARGGKFVARNCVNTDKRSFKFRARTLEISEVAIELQKNTFFGSALTFTLDAMATPPESNGARSQIEVWLLDNVISSSHERQQEVLYVHQFGFKNPLSVNQVERLLPQRIELHDEHNLYQSPAVDLLTLAVDWQPQESNRCKDLEDWLQFWEQSESDSAEGAIRFTGGDLAARDFDELTPDDFRLRPDSAGYRAGPDGNDLGANIDFVGPGQAYDRWKKTREYQDWLEETQRLMSATDAENNDEETEE